MRDSFSQCTRHLLSVVKNTLIIIIVSKSQSLLQVIRHPFSPNCKKYVRKWEAFRDLKTKVAFRSDTVVNNDLINGEVRSNGRKSNIFPAARGKENRGREQSSRAFPLRNEEKSRRVSRVNCAFTRTGGAVRANSVVELEMPRIVRSVGCFSFVRAKFSKERK